MPCPSSLQSAVNRSNYVRMSKCMALHFTKVRYYFEIYEARYTTQQVKGSELITKMTGLLPGKGRGEAADTNEKEEKLLGSIEHKNVLNVSSYVHGGGNVSLLRI